MKLKIPSFNMPRNTDDYYWECVKLQVDGENLPVHRLREIAGANCPFMKIIDDSMFIRRQKTAKSDLILLYYAVEKDKYMKKAEYILGLLDQKRKPNKRLRKKRK